MDKIRLQIIQKSILPLKSVVIPKANIRITLKFKPVRAYAVWVCAVHARFCTKEFWCPNRTGKEAQSVAHSNALIALFLVHFWVVRINLE